LTDTPPKEFSELICCRVYSSVADPPGGSACMGLIGLLSPTVTPNKTKLLWI